MLLVLNGPPAVGKSTLAHRYVEDHPLALVVDIDHLRSQLGRWQTVGESKLVARDLAVALVRTHMHAGYDVIVPQYLGRPAFLERLEQVATDAGAVFIEIVLTDDVEHLTERFRSRRAGLADTGASHPEADLDDADVDADLRTSNAQLLQRAASHGLRVVSANGGPEATYQALRRVLDPAH